MEDIRKATLKMMENNTFEVQSLPLDKDLDKGDVIFWHPFTIHGSHQNINPKYSRKSFTSHLYPYRMKKMEKDYSKQLHIKETYNPNLSTSQHYRGITWSLKNYVNYFLTDTIHAKKALRDMRKSSYQD